MNIAPLKSAYIYNLSEERREIAYPKLQDHVALLAEAWKGTQNKNSYKSQVDKFDEHNGTWVLFARTVEN